MNVVGLVYRPLLRRRGFVRGRSGISSIHPPPNETHDGDGYHITKEHDTRGARKRVAYKHDVIEGAGDLGGAVGRAAKQAGGTVFRKHVCSFDRTDA